jgi:hypothetical protein
VGLPALDSHKNLEGRFAGCGDDGPGLQQSLLLGGRLTRSGDGRFGLQPSLFTAAICMPRRNSAAAMRFLPSS